MGLLTFLLLASLYQFSTKNIRKIALSQKDLLFFSTTLLGIIALLETFSTDHGYPGRRVPSPSPPPLISISSRLPAVRCSSGSSSTQKWQSSSPLLSSYFSAVLMGNQLFFFIFTFVGSVIGAHKVARCEQRSILIKAGLTVGGINLLMIICLQPDLRKSFQDGPSL